MPRFTTLLDAVASGDAQAAGELFDLVYDDLKRLARHQFAGEGAGHTLQPTALVHEVYLRLIRNSGQETGDQPISWQGRGHFFAAAAQAMRHILVESARRKKRAKHGGGRAREPIDPDQIAEPELSDELLALDAALDTFSKQEPTIAQLVVLRYFGGLTLKDAAATLGIPLRTASSYWAFARAWLQAEIERDGQNS